MRVLMTRRELWKRLADFQRDPENHIAVERDDGPQEIYILRIALGNGDETIQIEIEPEITT